MNELLKKIREIGIIPIVKIDDASKAIPLGEALIKGGVPTAEITLRTPAAVQVIKDMTDNFPDMIVGAGTVLNIEQVKQAVGAGAKFVVSPGFNPAVVQYCVDNEILIIPGCSNPTDIELALSFGLDTVKFFPVEALGGITTLKVISGPYGMMNYVPTGSIKAEGINDYLAFDKILACGGSWMVKEEFIKNGNYEEITRITKEVVDRMLGFEIAHIGINNEDSEKSMEVAKRFSQVFNMPVKEESNSIFAGTIVEAIKGKGRGSIGHIAIKTNSILRAAAYLKRNGIEFDISNADDSKMESVYLKEEIGGFAIKLVQKK